jgi:hypothetical protein
MKINAITICVNYADYLKLTLPENLDFFDTCLVVTDYNDKETEEICSKYEQVTVLKTDAFYKNNAPFAKSAGINAGLKLLPKDEWVVHWDADMLVGKNFESVKKLTKLDQTKLYGPHEKLHTQKNEMGSNHHSGGTACAGFFQLFHASQLDKVGGYPETSKDCSCDDTLFSLQFNSVSYIDFQIFHLGPTAESRMPNVNWKGRKSCRCLYDKTDIKDFFDLEKK